MNLKAVVLDLVCAALVLLVGLGPSLSIVGGDMQQVLYYLRFPFAAMLIGVEYSPFYLQPLARQFAYRPNESVRSRGKWFFHGVLAGLYCTKVVLFGLFILALVNLFDQTHV